MACLQMDQPGKNGQKQVYIVGCIKKAPEKIYVEFHVSNFTGKEIKNLEFSIEKNPFGLQCE